jgi:hypothetical protein
MAAALSVLASAGMCGARAVHDFGAIVRLPATAVDPRVDTIIALDLDR